MSINDSSQQHSRQTTCPRCARPNACGLATGEEKAAACWCFSLDLEPASRKSITEAFPAEDQCLCATCLQEINAPSQ